jgi:porphobilinogen synthase
LCLCEFTDHAHCGILADGRIDNDATLDCIRRVAVSHAAAGADVVAPSGMMDGAVGAIRQELDANGFDQVLTMPYSAKYASAFYGPFKEATLSVPGESLHATHQIQSGNARQAMREVALDIEEGADIVMVKPALPSLDIIHRVATGFRVPVAAYQVSGTYRMLLDSAADAAEAHRLQMEVLTCIKRAGAGIIISYYAKEACLVPGGENQYMS